jgi:hypothetical protein
MKRVFAVLLLLGGGAAPGAEPQHWDFTVFLDQREIGSHRFSLTPGAADGMTLTSRAALRVRILGISAYRYDHDDTEQWSGGCLRAIASRTTSGGKTFQVDGASTAAGLMLKKVVEGKHTDATHGGCISSFAYWDGPSLLQQKQLLNSQTGELLAVQIAPLEPATVERGGRKIAVNRYRIIATATDITLGYAQEGGDWLSLESVVEGGRHLRYVRR